MIFASGFSKPEGPVLLNDQSWIVAEMGEDRGCITQIRSDGSDRKIVAKTGCPNGLAVDRYGTIWVAESNPDAPAFLRVGLDGNINPFLVSCNDFPLLFPNDLTFGPDGDIYMTDSGVSRHAIEPDGKLCENYRSLETDGKILRANVKTKQVEIIDAGLKFVNGIAFDRDSNLYACETFTGWVYKYRKLDDRNFGPREAFANVIIPGEWEGFLGPDGMAFDVEGRLYAAIFGQAAIVVLDPDGKIERIITTAGKYPTNVAFGPAGSKTIYVTECEHGTLEVFDSPQDGLALNE
jgi:gluconolactonase